MNCCSQFFGAILVYMIVISIVSQSDGREIRPSDHGLVYQDSPAPVEGENSTEMLSFFGGPESNVQLPEARNMSNPSDGDGDGDGGERGNGGGGHVIDVMFVASLACGVTGVVLFIAAASVLVFRFRNKNKTPSTSLPLQQPPLLALDYKITDLNNDIKPSCDKD